MTHFLINRALEEIAAQVEKRVAAERERDEARAELAEVRRIVTETLPDLADQPDRETTVRRVAALATRYQYERDALKAEVEKLHAEADELRRRIHDALSARTKEGMLASEWIARTGQAEREAREARAEVERLRGELEVKSNWETVAVAQNEEIERLRGELDYRNEAPDAAALRAEGTTLAKMTRDAVGDEPDAHALAVYGYVSKVDQFLTRLRAAPPSFHLTDIEAASYDVCAANYPGGIDSDRAEEVLRKHTRPIDRERLAGVLYGIDQRRIGVLYNTWEPMPDTVRPRWLARADTVLRYLGAQPTQPVEQVIDLTTTLDEARRKLTHLSAADADHLRVIITRNLRPGFALAQPVEPKPAKPRGGFVVDRDRFNGIANRAGLAVARAIDECIAEIERQRAEWAGGTK